MSEAVAVRVIFSPAKQMLLNVYSKEKDVPSDSWPPFVTDSYISLALVEPGPPLSSNYSFYGDPIATKEKILVDYGELFGELEAGALLLAEGRPGSGKTTLVHKISRDWAKGIVLKNMKILFRIILRNFNRTKNCNDLSSILGHCFHGKHIKELITELEENDGEGVCFILDGLDEYNPQDVDKSVVHKLIYKKYLTQSVVIVSSRPAATAMIRENAPVNKKIEVMGFVKETVFEYIDKYPFPVDQPNSKSELKLYLRVHPTVFSMCYLPVNTAIICFIYSKEGSIPDRETLIYKKFSQLFILRQLTRKNQMARLHSLEELTGKEKEFFYDLCHLAFDMITEGRQVIYKHEISFPFHDESDPDYDVTFGLVTKDLVPELFGMEPTYSFLHLTLQDFLAAFYMAQLDPEAQREISVKYSFLIGVKTLKVSTFITKSAMWKFYFGLATFKGDLSHFDVLMQSIFLEPGIDLVYESQQPIVCDRMCRSPGTIDFRFPDRVLFLKILDPRKVCYVISNTSSVTTEINVWADKWTAAAAISVSNLVKYLGQMFFHMEDAKQDYIQAFRFLFKKTISSSKYGKIHQEHASYLLHGLICFKYLQNLCVSLLDFQPDDFVTISMHFNLLMFFGMWYAKISLSAVRSFVSQKRLCNNLRSLEILHSNFNDECASALAEAADCFKNLLCLDCSYNRIRDCGARALLSKFLNSRTLEDFHIYCNYLTKNIDLHVLADNFHSNSTLKRLGLSIINLYIPATNLETQLNEILQNRTNKWECHCIMADFVCHVTFVVKC